MRYVSRTFIVCLISVLGVAAAVRVEAAKAGKAAATQEADRGKLRRIRFLDPEHAPKGKGWIPLFNGKDTEGWHLRHKDHPSSWSVTDGILQNKAPGVDLISDQKFWNFEAYYEYRVPKGSNSGFYLRGRYEIQVFDSFGQPADVHGNGSIYGVKAPSKNVSRAPDQWQSVYARIVGNKVTVIMNGEKIIEDFEVTRATGMELDQDYDKPGPIFLQGDHGAVDFRYIYVKPIKEAE